jgi:CRP/FNR family transcriptional regulator
MSQKTSAPGCFAHCERNVKRPAGDAADCPLHTVCGLGTGGDGSLPVAERRIARNQSLFEAGEAFHGVYVVRAGAFKTLAVLAGQEDQVVDFRLPGDLLGMSAMGRGRYAFTALALEPSVLCQIGVEAQAGLYLHPDLVATMSRQLQRIQWASVLLRTQSAEQRVIHFLLDIARGSASGDNQVLGMKLPMSRRDIANYLGVAVETVSRSLHRLQAEGLLTTSGRHMELRDRTALAQRLEGTEPVVYS